MGSGQWSVCECVGGGGRGSVRARHAPDSRASLWPDLVDSGRREVVRARLVRRIAAGGDLREQQLIATCGVERADHSARIGGGGGRGRGGSGMERTHLIPSQLSSTHNHKHKYMQMNRTRSLRALEKDRLLEQQSDSARLRAHPRTTHLGAY